MNRCVWGASSVIRLNRSPSGLDFLLSAFSQSLETALKYCNYFFSSTFVVETVLKLVAFGFRRFFKDRWAHDWNNTSRASGGSGLWWALCAQVESAGSGHRSAVCDGNHSGGDWNKRFASHQSHHHPHHEGPAHRPRWARSLIHTRRGNSEITTSKITYAIKNLRSSMY